MMLVTSVCSKMNSWRNLAGRQTIEFGEPNDCVFETTAWWEKIWWNMIWTIPELQWPQNHETNAETAFLVWVLVIFILFFMLIWSPWNGDTWHEFGAKPVPFAAEMLWFGLLLATKNGFDQSVALEISCWIGMPALQRNIYQMNHILSIDVCCRKPEAIKKWIFRNIKNHWTAPFLCSGFARPLLAWLEEASAAKSLCLKRGLPWARKHSAASSRTHHVCGQKNWEFLNINSSNMAINIVFMFK